MNCTKDDEVTGCTCPGCAAGWLAYTRGKRMERSAALDAGKATVQHGTNNGYLNYLCRCDECKAANREYQKQQVKDRRARETPEHVHGTASGYTNYGCRCDLCKGAIREYARKRQAARGEGK